MFIEVKCSDGIRRLVSLMRIDTIEPDLGSSRIWVGETSYIASEHHFLGPYKFMAEAQQEMNRMGSERPAWSVHGWEFNAKGEIIVMMVRSVEIKPHEEA